MKEIKSDKVFEKKIRIYQINRLEELNEFYQKHKREYKNMNEFLVSLIFAGLDSETNFEKDARTYFTKAQGISDNIASLSNTLSNIKKTQTNEYTDMVKLAYELRLLLYRIYNGIFYLSDKEDIKGVFNAGFKDDEPEGFADDRSLISKQVDAEFGKDIKIIQLFKNTCLQEFLGNNQDLKKRKNGKNIAAFDVVL